MAIPLAGITHKFRDFLAAQSMVCDVPGPGMCHLLCLRACQVQGDQVVANGIPFDSTNRYDDTMFAFGEKANGKGRFLQHFEASARPGHSWIRAAIYRGSGRGCPTVQPGQYAYVRGLHRGKPALRQAPGAAVLVIRDVDQDAHLEPTDIVDYPISTGINIHAGGRSRYVGRNSSGCQVIRGGWTGAAWQRFRDLIYRECAGQDLWHYTLMDWADFGAWHDAGKDQREQEALWFGSSGTCVAELQELLVREGYLRAHSVGAIWEPATDRAVRRWQRDRGVMEVSWIRWGEVRARRCWGGMDELCQLW